MSVNWEEIFCKGIQKLESEFEDSWQTWDRWTETFWDDDLQERSANFFYDRATDLYRQQQYSQAIKNYTQTIKSDPEYYQAYFYRGACHCKLNRLQQGLKDYSQAIEIKPDFTDGFYYRGTVRHSLGDLSGAIADYTKVIQLDPDRLDAYFNRGAMFAAIGDYYKTIQDFSKLIDFAPTASKHYNRGTIYYLMAEYEQAIEDFSQAVALEPEFIAAYLYLGNAYHALDNSESATTNYAIANAIEDRLDPQDEHGYYAQGVAALNQGEQEKSIEYLTKAVFLCRENNNLALQLKIIEIQQEIELAQ